MSINQDQINLNPLSVSSQFISDLGMEMNTYILKTSLLAICYCSEGKGKVKDYPMYRITNVSEHLYPK